MSLILKGKLNQRGHCKASLFISHSTLNTALEVCRVKTNILSIVKSSDPCSNVLKLDMSGQDPLGNVIVNYVQDTLDVDCEQHCQKSPCNHNLDRRLYQMSHRLMFPRHANLVDVWRRSKNRFCIDSYNVTLKYFMFVQSIFLIVDWLSCQVYLIHI